MDHLGLRHHDEEHHFDEVKCPGCGKFFNFGKGKPTTCMVCDIDLRPMRSKTSPANQEDMHERNLNLDGRDSGGNSLAEGILKSHGSASVAICPECGSENKLKHLYGKGRKCNHCHALIPDPLKSDAKGLGKLDPYKESDPESMSTAEKAGWGGGGSRHLKDEGFTASVHVSDNLQFEIVEVLEPESEITESQHKQTLHFPNGITDALHEALNHLNAWVENPEENGKLRPYREYSGVVRPKINVGQICIGVEDPHMAEIINHVAQTNDVSAIYKDSSVQKESGFLAALIPEGIAALAGEGALAGGLGNLLRTGLMFKGAESALGTVGDIAGNVLGIGGDGGGESAAIAQEAGGPNPFLTPVSHVATYGDKLETPDSISERKDTDDPHHIDPHTKSDGDNSEWQKDFSVNGEGQSRSPRGEDKLEPEVHEALEKFFGLLPLVMHYYEHGGGIEDPLMVSLHESLEKAFPNYLESDDVHPDENPILKLISESKDSDSREANVKQSLDAFGPSSMAPPATPGNQPMTVPAQVPAMQGKDFKGHTTESCNIADCPQCAQSASKANQPSVPTNITQPGQFNAHDPAQVAQRSQQAAQAQADNEAKTNDKIMQMIQPKGSVEAASHQGPHTHEQFVAVGELLEEEGRDDEVLEMLKQPEDYAEELAEVQQSEPLAEDIEVDAEQAPPVPAQTGATPNQGLPMPAPGGAGGPGGAPPSGGGMQMGASMLKAAFKYSADNVAGKCPKCKGHSTKMIKQDGKCKCHSCGHTWKDKHFEPSDGDSSNSSTTASFVYSFEIEEGYEREHEIEEDAHDFDTQLWKDTNGAPIKSGQRYTLRQGSDAIGDPFLVEDIKSGKELVGTINPDSNAPQHITLDPSKIGSVTLEEVSGVNHSENPPGIEENADGKPLPEAGSDNTDLSTPHRFITNTKFAGKHYTPVEQKELINERGEARNADKLDLRNTHYIEEDDDSFLFGC